MAIYEITLKKRKGEDLTPDLINVIHEKLNDDPAFLSLVTDPVPNKGINDEGKPYIVFVGENSAIVIIRENDNKVLVAFIKSPGGLRQIDSALRNKYKIFLFKGRTAPFEFAIKQHILELIAEEPETDEKDTKDISDEQEEMEKEEGPEQREKKEMESDELTEEYDKLFRIKG